MRLCACVCVSVYAIIINSTDWVRTDDIIKNVCAKSEQLSHHKMGIVTVIHGDENG